MIVCPYHGWQYTGEEGRLGRAVNMKGIEKFAPRENSLLAVQVTTLGPLIFARCPSPSTPYISSPPSPYASSANAAASVTHPVSPSAHSLSHPDKVEDTFAATFPQLPALLGDLSTHTFVSRHTYSIKCNWKVFADNYLDGGYHISKLHPGLASQLSLPSYRSHLYDLFSVQVCDALPAEKRHLAGNEVPERVGSPVYAWLFPTTAINKYGSWMDVHTVQPTGPSSCFVTFDYFAQRDFLSGLSPDDLAAQIRASCDVQQEDIDICERVQVGLVSDAYSPGRYAAPETPSHHFHTLLAKYI